ncbi:hypothetical protein EDB86DRAFT_2829776 [Lactarius hatsudake]|nr:hypothetical protein EDB86DRAFT_2829776 [Lactarius hatsudake]
MAAPPGPNDRNDQTYSPSKLSALPNVYLTPSNDSLNNSGTYAPAILGPITASGYGPPARRDGQAYWNDSAPTPQPILVSSTSPTPAAGRSPQDSVMGSPESEEPTVPNILTTQIGRDTQDAIMAALPSAPTDSQQLWDNVPSLPADLPPQPEVIELEDPMFLALAVADGNNRVFTWRSLGAAIRAHILPAPMDPNMIRMSAYDPDGDEDETLAEINLTLTDEINRDVSSVLQGWSTYRLQHLLELWKGHELPTTANEFNCMTKNILTALDAGAAAHDGETMIKGLTPQSWTRLTMATLSAILRGALRSPATLRTGARSLNGIDSFPLHKDVDHPLTEGGAIMLMCQQLEGLYRSNRNHPDKTYPDSYYDRLVTLLDSRMHQVPLPADTPAPAPLTEVDRAQVNAAIREKLILDGLEAARVDPTLMGEIKEAVKAEIFANLNAEALTNIDDWRAIYKYEFTEAMHTAFEAQYPGIHPGKGKAKEAPPITHSQVVQEAQPRIKEEVRLQVNARISSIHEEIKTSIANDDPFWKQGPLRETIATELRTATTIQVQQELEQELCALKTAAEEELNAFKTQLQFNQDQAHEALHREARAEYDSAKALFTSNLEEDVKEFKNSITASVKDWKDQFRTARNLSALKRKARRFGVNLVPIDEESSAAQKILFNKTERPALSTPFTNIYKVHHPPQPPFRSTRP